MDRASDAAKKPTVIDSTKQVYTLENLAGMPSWKIQGAGDPDLASAMTKMQGERDKATGEWIPLTTKAKRVMSWQRLCGCAASTQIELRVTTRPCWTFATMQKELPWRQGKKLVPSMN